MMATEFVATACFSTPTCTCYPAFDIVHPLDYTTCLHHMGHLANPGPSGTHSSFQGASRKCDNHPTAGSLNGFFASGGVQLEQSCTTADLIAHYRDQRDEALELANRRAAELLASKGEMHRLQQELRALQVLFDEMVDFAASERSISGDRMTRLENILLGPSRADPQEAEETFTPEPRVPLIDEPRLPTPPVSPARIRSVLPTPHSTPESLPPLAPTLPTIDTSPPEGSPLSSTDEIYQLLLPTSPDEVTAHLARSFAEENFDTSASNTPGSTLELNELMDDARDGDGQALLRINELYMEAHLTPSKDRTSLQQFLIYEWKDVRPSLLTPPTPTRPAISLSESDTPEIFVDASGWGVGFVLNGRWLAWKLKPGWRCEGRDNNWAEMVAIELGLHVAIAAGFRSQTIVMRSDNWGVVRSLLRGKSRHSTQPEILKKITALAGRYDVDLIPVWVPTAENPADKPSRGVFPPMALRFPVSISLPAHLTPFLNPSIEFHSPPL